MVLFREREKLRERFRTAKPFPFLMIDSFIEDGLAQRAAAAYPSFERALDQGRSFNAVNERRKIQITDSKKFPEPIARINEMLAAPSFLKDLSDITEIPNLMADSDLVGAGMHMTGPGGRLDVHVDFNFMQERKLFRRLNLLLYLNTSWQDSWGGHIQLWDQNVQNCLAAFAPRFNRCVIFETSEISFHGVVPVTPNAPSPRISFATYYYTKESPPGWTGIAHSTIFKARPDERVRKFLLMPAEHLHRTIDTGIRKIKSGMSRFVPRS